MKEMNIPSTRRYQDIIADQSFNDRKMFGRTLRPFLNVFRWWECPCDVVGRKSYNCRGDAIYHPFEVTLKVIGLCIILCFCGIAAVLFTSSWSALRWLIPVVVTLIFVFGRIETSACWNEHHHALEEMRAILHAKSRGSYLTAGLQNDISKTERILLGEISSHQRFREYVRRYMRRENVVAGYRDSACFVRVRIDAGPNELISTAFSRDFFIEKTTATLSRLQENAMHIGESFDRLQWFKDRPSNPVDEEEWLTRAAESMQNSVDNLYKSLRELASDADSENAKSLQALVHAESAKKSGMDGFVTALHRDMEDALRDVIRQSYS